ncbi:hypothetical protein OHA72_10750 [Dactylosporangium sp. NBC_01737]|uniref:hypothetical protein n=1 Tax=Dactylosporangium sp. NBC_01737 TaxID=2975959 RepID=UPI002E0D5D75|nr:hypothetical protein OHA72_10750 [Dactylosporangium sp. NBC_01737]
MFPNPLPQISAVLPGPGWARLGADSAGVLLDGQPLVTGWLAPDIESANRVVADLTLLIEYVVEHDGAAYLAEDRSGIAVWAGATEPLPPVAALRRSTVDPHYAARWAALEGVLRSTVPDGARGEVLVLLAMAGDGPVAGQLAAELLRQHHRVLDQQERPACTAAYTIELRWLLARHGWTAGPRGHLPDGSPWWPMHRRPQPPTTPSTPSTPSVRPAAGGRIWWAT